MPAPSPSAATFAPRRIEPKLEPDAIGVAQDTVIGMASAAPGVSVGLTLAALAAASAYAGPLVIAVTAVPMLVIANAYRRLNMWQANCGASFEWVGRSISPYLGFITGWIMIAAYVTGAVSGVEVIGPNVLAVVTSRTPAGPWDDIIIATGITVIMVLIAVIGIRLTARTQVAMAAIEYSILAGFAVAGLVLVLRHAPGTFPITAGWFSPHGVNGHGSLALGLLTAVYIYSGWDGTLYVNEEVRHRRVNPGRAAMWAVVILTLLYAVVIAGLQGVVSPARLQAHASAALVYAAQAIGGPAWARVMAFALALSVIAATGTSIVLTARIILGMASYRTLPGRLATVSGRFATPVSASVLDRGRGDRPDLGVPAGHLGPGRVHCRGQRQRAAVRGLLRPDRARDDRLLPPAPDGQPPRRRHPWPAPHRSRCVPGLGAGQVQPGAGPSQNWSLLGVLAAGLVLMLLARFGLRSDFFALPRESDTSPKTGSHGRR